MIVDERVLTANFQPAEILHRHDEISTLSRTLQPISEGVTDSGAGAFIWGPTGSGKTCTTTYLLEELSETTEINSLQVDCWQQDTSSALYHSLLHALDPGHTPKHGTTPKTVIWQQIVSALESDQQFVIVLDEVDQLEDQKALFQFYEHDKITPILIANRKHDFFAGLDERVGSRLRGYTSVHFDRYRDAEIVAILETRARAALAPDVVTQDHLETIAAHAQGDARLAIAILRNAVRQAKPAGEFRDDHITDAVAGAQTALQEDTLEKLTDLQRILLDELTTHGEQSLSELYERYCANGHVDEPVVKRTVRKHLAKMADYDLVLRNGVKSNRTYEPALKTPLDG